MNTTAYTEASPATTPQRAEAAQRIIARCREIAECTEVPGQITRTFLSAPMHEVHTLLKRWMHDAGLATTLDEIGNLRGLRPGSTKDAPRVILASHLDTVPNAGAFDGILGVVLATAVAEELPHDFPLAIEVIGFSEEEGVRFRKPFLGSLALVGSLAPETLALTDSEGISLAEAIRNFGLDSDHIADALIDSTAVAYIEVHIEQGPVLESMSRSSVAQRSRIGHIPSILGVVETIVGQSRLALTFRGQANHAGTTPMELRQDALAAAAEWIVAVEAHARSTPGLVATVGQISASPGAINIIPGTVTTSLDVRHASDPVRSDAVRHLLDRAEQAAASRGVELEHEVTSEQAAVQMDARLVRLLETAVARAGYTPHRMPSGAGHDAMTIAPHLPSAMLFVPSPGGLSHHPEESVNPEDVEAALNSVLEFLRLLSDHGALANA